MKRDSNTGDSWPVATETSVPGFKKDHTTAVFVCDFVHVLLRCQGVRDCPCGPYVRFSKPAIVVWRCAGLPVQAITSVTKWGGGGGSSRFAQLTLSGIT